MVGTGVAFLGEDIIIEVSKLCGQVETKMQATKCL
jgi:hypothetical protein